MIGLKSASAVAVSAALVAIGAARGVLSPGYLASLSGAAWFAIGLCASLALALVGVGWRFGVRSRGAIALAGGRPAIVEDPAEPPRELPAFVQRALVLAGFGAVALGALGNHAAARIVRLPEQLEEPSPSAYCLPREASGLGPRASGQTTAPEAPQAGCALVRRAYQLGYAKSLGSCAPKRVKPEEKKPEEKAETCDRRRLGEPYLHYAYRRVAGAFGAVAATSPGDAAEHRVDDVRAHLDYLDGLLADIRHAITGSPHASHHVWITLPDPHPGSWRERFTGAPRCSTRFADLPLWPSWKPGDESRLVEHVLGQLLFASRFGTAASCNDYTIHWGAPVDACAQLAADPARFLAREGALASIRAVLDRRHRELELAELDARLGRRPPPPPPPPSALVSVQCFAIDPAHAGPPAGRTVTLDGEQLGLREIHVAGVRATDDGPIDVYLELAALLGGTDLVHAAHETGPVIPATPQAGSFFLTHADELVDASPFAGARAPLARPDLVAIYPFQRHLYAFVDAFRRRYLPQRGRL